MAGRPPIQRKTCLDCKEYFDINSRYYYCDDCLDKRRNKSKEYIKQKIKKRAKYDIKKEEGYNSEERPEIINQWF